jgi:hypothetical protein
VGRGGMGGLRRHEEVFPRSVILTSVAWLLPVALIARQAVAVSVTVTYTIFGAIDEGGVITVVTLLGTCSTASVLAVVTRGKLICHTEGTIASSNVN